jgi:hypothetical protein
MILFGILSISLLLLAGQRVASSQAHSDPFALPGA